MEHIRVRSDGAIVFPLIGKMKVVGLTASQLTTDLDARLSRYYYRPHVSLGVVDKDGNAAR